jgi:hypothetical protein
MDNRSFGGTIKKYTQVTASEEGAFSFFLCNFLVFIIFNKSNNAEEYCCSKNNILTYFNTYLFLKFLRHFAFCEISIFFNRQILLFFHFLLTVSSPNFNNFQCLTLECTIEHPIFPQNVIYKGKSNQRQTILSMVLFCCNSRKK